MEQVREFLEKAWQELIERISRGNAQDSMAVIAAYGVLLGVISLSLLFSWFFNGIKTGSFDSAVMLQFFTAATGAGPVAAVTFLSVFFVDKNGDGRPDASENKAEEKKEINRR